MKPLRALAAAARHYSEQARTVAGYVIDRMLEKSTWASIGAAVVAANALQPVYGAATIAVACVVAVLPSPTTKA